MFGAEGHAAGLLRLAETAPVSGPAATTGSAAVRADPGAVCAQPRHVRRAPDPEPAADRGGHPDRPEAGRSADARARHPRRLERAPQAAYDDAGRDRAASPG